MISEELGRWQLHSLTSWTPFSAGPWLVTSRSEHWRWSTARSVLSWVASDVREAPMKSQRFELDTPHGRPKDYS